MGSLFDELKKAKLIDKKKEKQLRHEQRTRGKRDQDKDKESDKKRKQHEARRASQKAQDKARSKEAQRAKQERARWAELKQLIQSRQLQRENGRRRWHYVTSNGRVPFFEVSESTGKRLEAGELAIVRDPNLSYAGYTIVPREIGQRLQEMQPDLVCYLRG
jgi:uncharacterized protein YaiL (DUF2058 family)